MTLKVGKGSPAGGLLNARRQPELRSETSDLELVRWRVYGACELDDDCRAVWLDAIDSDVAVVTEDDVVDDGESEAGAPAVAGSGVIEADESFEHPLPVLGGDAGSIIAHLQRDRVRLCSELYG